MQLMDLKTCRRGSKHIQTVLSWRLMVTLQNFDRSPRSLDVGLKIVKRSTHGR
jgi:hypothetical protein